MLKNINTFFNRFFGPSVIRPFVWGGCADDRDCMGKGPVRGPLLESFGYFGSVPEVRHGIPDRFYRIRRASP